MALIHYLFLGHFEQREGLVYFSKSLDDSVFRPVTRQPLDTKMIQTALEEAKGATVADLAFPEDWMVWLRDGYLVCEKFTRNPAVIHFVSSLVELTQCGLCDASTHSLIALHDWLAATHDYAKP